MAGPSFHRPEKFDRKRVNDKVIHHQIKEILEKLTVQLADEEMLVFAVEEVRIDQEAVVRRAWYEKNTKTVVKGDRQKSAQELNALFEFLD